MRIRPLSDPGKPRPYRAPRRDDAARRTRGKILDAARRLFADEGYAGATIAAIARDAGVAVDTVYASVGRKPALFRLLVETAISGGDEPVPAEERDYVRRIRETRSARGKLEAYAAATRAIHARLAPLVVVLRAAAPGEPELMDLWHDIAERRAGNMRLLAADLSATGELDPSRDLQEVADIIWATNSADLYLLLVDERGWGPERYERWLADAWCRLLL